MTTTIEAEVADAEVIEITAEQLRPGDAPHDPTAPTAPAWRAVSERATDAAAVVLEARAADGARTLMEMDPKATITVTRPRDPALAVLGEDARPRAYRALSGRPITVDRRVDDEPEPAGPTA